MSPPPGTSRAPGPASTYVQAVPIYMADDVEVGRYFREHRDEIDAISGDRIAILLATEIRAADAPGIVAAVEGSRFAGLAFDDLPCLWVEDQFNRSAIIKLPPGFADIGRVLRTVSEVCRHTKDAPEIKARVAARLKADTGERSLLAAALVGELPVTKSTERLIALICGVAFVAAILAVALFIPAPTPFQYTIFRIVLALAASGFVSMTPGFIEAKVGNGVRAGGALAVFVVVFFFAPAAINAIH